MLAVRIYKRRQSVEGEIDAVTLALLEAAGTTPAEVEAIYRMTTLPTLEERFVLPPYHREMSIESLADPLAHKGDTGFGYLQAPLRGA
jgi:nitrate reductase beta subunit